MFWIEFWIEFSYFLDLCYVILYIWNSFLYFFSLQVKQQPNSKVDFFLKSLNLLKFDMLLLVFICIGKVFGVCIWKSSFVELFKWFFIFNFFCFQYFFCFYIFLFLFYLYQVVLLYDLHYNSLSFNFFHHILDFYYGLLVHGCYYQVDVELMYE
jgi:hypothetical protein